MLTEPRYTANGAAKALNLKHGTVASALHAGRLVGQRVGWTFIIEREDLLRWYVECYRPRRRGEPAQVEARLATHARLCAEWKACQAA